MSEPVSTEMRRNFLVIFVILALFVVSSAVVSAELGTTLSSENSTSVQEEGDFNFTSFTIHIHSNGDSTWTVEYQRELKTHPDIEGFRTYKTKYENGEVTPFEDLGRLRPIIEDAENITGRNMNFNIVKREVVIEDTLTGKRGVARAVFNWTNFAKNDTRYLRVGDVFAGGGFALRDNMRLIIEYDSKFKLDSVIPEPDVEDTNSVQWDGEKTFEDSRPKVVLEKPESMVPDGSDGGDSNDQNGDNDSNDNGSTNGPGGENGNGENPDQSGLPFDTILVILAVGAVLAAFVVGAYLGGSLRPGRVLESGETTPPRQEPRNSEVGGTSKTQQNHHRNETKESQDQTEEQVSGTETETGTGTGTGTETGTEDTKPAPTTPQTSQTESATQSSETENGTVSEETEEDDIEVDEELLTDEDRVVRLLDDNGGKMKQADIVDSTGWSKSKVSMVLSDMEDEGTISKLRLGRENVISLENADD